LSFEEMSALKPAVERALFTSTATTMSSGVSLASGAIHWIMKNAGIPYWRPSSSRPWANGRRRRRSVP